jgi:hypothetical protein
MICAGYELTADCGKVGIASQAYPSMETNWWEGYMDSPAEWIELRYARGEA